MTDTLVQEVRANDATVQEPAPPAPDPSAQRVVELTEIIQAYNQVTERLQISHEQLTQEVNRLRDQLASANEALQRSRRLAALGEMAAGIAHEIRNPLASIQLYVGMLISDLGGQPDAKRVAEQIAQAVRGLNAVVGDVLTFSRELNLRPRKTYVAPVIERTIAELEPMLAEGRTETVIKCDEALVAEIDAELVHRALGNLVRNAAEAMPEGGRVTIAAEGEGPALRLTVRDTGPGISRDHVDRIFNPFFTTRHAGTGLGLAIVHRIADAHGGSITVHNDGGAVFTLELPRRAMRPATEMDDDAAAAG